MINIFDYFFKKEIPILMYHRLIDNKENIGVHTIYYDVNKFEKQLIYLEKNGYKTITFKELKNMTEEQKKKEKYIILTFDDGYKDNYELLFPLLKKYKMKAVIYMISHLKDNKWDVDETGEKRFELMNLDQILEMHKSGLIEFGGHTMHHVKLNELNYEKQKEEIEGNKIYLEKLLNEKLVSFAYPFGFFNEESKKAVKELGYKYGVATDSGPFYINDDLYEIRRIGIFPDVTMSKFKRRVKGNYNLKKCKK
ncbi:polysaccharide deacetylase family protein [Fusobacterium ulcerans]|uniref:polysaccharide deacetylase family protein n=1 Tax=Fusobacterium ulcerans TaxID=861 RepID=UPI0030B5851A